MSLRKRMGLLLIISFFCTIAYAQPTNRPNRPPQPPLNEQQFREMVVSESETDSLLELYVRYALQNLRRSPGMVLELSDEINGKDDIPEIKKNAYVNYLKGMYWYNPMPDSAVKYFGIAEQQFKELRYEDYVIEVMRNKARSLSRINEFLLAEDTYFDLIEYIDENVEEQGIVVIALNELSDLYMRVGATEIALNRLREVLEIEGSTPQAECTVRLKMSNAYKRNLDFDLAREELLPCVDREGTDMPLQISILKSLSDLGKIMGNPEERLKWIQDAVEIQNQTTYQDFNTLFFLGEAYFDNKMYTQVDSMILILDNFDTRRLQIPQRVNYLIFKAKNSLSKERNQQAIAFAEEGLALTSRMPAETPLSIELSRVMAEAYEGNGNFEQAYTILKDLEEKDRFITEQGRIREEEINKVRFQMRAKNQELAQVTSKLGTVRVRTALIILLFFLAGSYLIYRYRLTALLEQERTRNRIARDLHDDLSATLSSISFFTEAVRRDDSGASGKKYLGRIEQSAAEAKEKINDIIWAIDPENDDWEMLITKFKRFAAEMFESKEIKYTLNFDKDIQFPLKLELKQDLWLIFKEMVNNLVRHSGATEAEVSFKQEGKAIVLTVSDNGEGFSEEEIEEGKGVRNIRFRAERIGGVSKLSSSKASGTRWMVSITA